MIPTEDGVKEKKIGDDKVIVLYMPGIHESIAGLIASKLKEAFYRPTLVLPMRKWTWTERLRAFD